MCVQWEFKMMACGHPTVDLEIVRCPFWDPDNEQECPFWFQRGVPEVRSYTVGDSECEACVGQKAMNAEWLRATGVVLDELAHVAFLTAGAYLRTLDFVGWEARKFVQHLLITEYIEEGTVLDIDGTLRELGYDIPEPIALSIEQEKGGLGHDTPNSTALPTEQEGELSHNTPKPTDLPTGQEEEQMEPPESDSLRHALNFADLFGPTYDTDSFEKDMEEMGMSKGMETFPDLGIEIGMPMESFFPDLDFKEAAGTFDENISVPGWNEEGTKET